MKDAASTTGSPPAILLTKGKKRREPPAVLQPQIDRKKDSDPLFRLEFYQENGEESRAKRSSRDSSTTINELTLDKGSTGDKTDGTKRENVIDTEVRCSRAHGLPGGGTKEKRKKRHGTGEDRNSFGRLPFTPRQGRGEKMTWQFF